MSVEFEKLVIEKLDFMTEKINKLDLDVTELKKDVAVLKEDVTVLKEDVTILKKEVAVLKDKVINDIEPRLEAIEHKVDIMVNVNTARILETQTRNHKELIRRLDKYQRENELEHSRLNYEICKLRANA